MKFQLYRFLVSCCSSCDAKNRDSHTLPMLDFIYDLFKRRHGASSSDYVFPASSDSDHMMEPRKAMLKVAQLLGVSFTVHDCRRTFITTAKSLDIFAYALKRLLNHKMNQDVTSGYLIIDVERLRKPTQQITDYLLKCRDVKQEEVIFLKQKKEKQSMGQIVPILFN